MERYPVKYGIEDDQVRDPCELVLGIAVGLDEDVGMRQLPHRWREPVVPPLFPPDEAKVENVRAMVDFTKDYGVYR